LVEDHGLVIRGLHGLAALFFNQGDYDKALPLFVECLEKRKSALGENHPKLLPHYNNLALLFSNQGRYDKALPLLDECLQVKKERSNVRRESSKHSYFT
jgi:tetratricopeptide (TPR) repeat protein